MSRNPAAYYVLVKRLNGWRWYAGRGYATGIGSTPRQWTKNWAGEPGQMCARYYDHPARVGDDWDLKGFRCFIFPTYRARAVQARLNQGLPPFDGAP
jgi:hypothetical protein